MNKIVLVVLLCLFANVNASTFKEVIEGLEQHDGVQAIYAKANTIEETGAIKGSWGDPMFKVAAKNFPNNSLKKDETPMTGIEFGISQKISLSTKYGNIQRSYESLGKAMGFNANRKKQFLVKNLWEIIITQRKLGEENTILKENFSWINKILKVSKKLYANGKISQQALLDIQIRKSEIESELSNKGFELSKIDDKINYLFTLNAKKFDYNSIPWNILEKSKKESLNDYGELTLKEKISAKEYALTASKQNYIPDLTFSLGYTRRANIDDNGDFVGASVSFPLPFSGSKYALHRKSTSEKYEATKQYEHYKRIKKRDSKILIKEVNKIENELSILKEKTIKFASNSRSISAKSYGLGNTTYIELLQSELKLQKILLKKIMLKAKRDINKITLKYILGDRLYE